MYHSFNRFFWQCAKFYENFMNFKTGQKTFHIILQFHKKIIATTSTSALTERSLKVGVMKYKQKANVKIFYVIATTLALAP